MNISDLYDLFNECLISEYTTTAEGADVCFKRDSEALFIFFEKSDGLCDWINNLSFCAQAYGNSLHPWKCHGGFLRVFKSVRAMIDHAITEQKTSSVTVVGYSHGAALAVLAHEYIWFNYPELRGSLKSIAYGCPRVIYGIPPSCVRNRWSRLLRVSHRGDLITHLPPAIFGFHHVGKLIRIGKPMLSGIDAQRPESYLTSLKRVSLTDRLLPTSMPK